MLGNEAPAFNCGLVPTAKLSVDQGLGRNRNSLHRAKMPSLDTSNATKIAKPGKTAKIGSDSTVVPNGTATYFHTDSIVACLGILVPFPTSLP